MNKNVEYCGECPFLETTSKGRNKCLVEGLWWLSYCGDIKSDAFDVNHPKRSEKCLRLVKHILKQAEGAE